LASCVGSGLARQLAPRIVRAPRLATATRSESSSRLPFASKLLSRRSPQLSDRHPPSRPSCAARVVGLPRCDPMLSSVRPVEKGQPPQIQGGHSPRGFAAPSQELLARRSWTGTRASARNFPPLLDTAQPPLS
jgi:hypothetical protein